MTEETKLKPCPFCGSKRVKVMQLSGTKNKYAVCLNCKASSNIAEREEDVVYLWNKRVEEKDD